MISRIDNEWRAAIGQWILAFLLTYAAFHLGAISGRREMIRKYDRIVGEKIDSMSRTMYLDTLSVVPAERSVPQPQGVQNEEGFNQRWKGR